MPKPVLCESRPGICTVYDQTSNKSRCEGFCERVSSHVSQRPQPCSPCTHLPLLQQLELFRTLDLGRSSLGFSEHSHQLLFDTVCHVLGVSTDVDVSPFLQDEGDELVSSVPKEILDVDFTCSG
jgi:hypothetical protein